MAGDGQNDDQVYIAGDADQGVRLDVFLAGKVLDISRSQLQRLIDTRAVQVNGSAAKSSLKMNSGDLVLVEVPAPRASHIAPEAIPLEVVYEDADLLVINKAKGMVVHPAPGSEGGTLVNALLAQVTDLSGIGGVTRPGIVHRLDKDTTGLLMVAKNDMAHQALQRQIQKRTASRRYLALVWGRPTFERAIVDVPIGRHPRDRKRMAVLQPQANMTVRDAITELRVVEQFGSAFALMECVLQTGRTHQIRVHCAHAGFPVVGDPVYGGLRKVGADTLRGPLLTRLNEQIAALNGQALHAFYLSFAHPTTGKSMTFEVPPPREMLDLLDLLRSIKEWGR